MIKIIPKKRAAEMSSPGEQDSKRAAEATALHATGGQPGSRSDRKSGVIREAAERGEVRQQESLHPGEGGAAGGHKDGGRPSWQAQAAAQSALGAERQDLAMLLAVENGSAGSEEQVDVIGDLPEPSPATALGLNTHPAALGGSGSQLAAAAPSAAQPAPEGQGAPGAVAGPPQGSQAAAVTGAAQPGGAPQLADTQVAHDTASVVHLGIALVVWDPEKEAEAHHEIVEMALPSHTTIADLKRRIYETDIHGQRFEQAAQQLQVVNEAPSTRVTPETLHETGSNGKPLTLEGYDLDKRPGTTVVYMRIEPTGSAEEGALVGLPAGGLRPTPPPPAAVAGQDTPGSTKKVRRNHKRWTDGEVARLVDGVEALGVGHWRQLKADFELDRSDVDLKDKWRNIKKAVILRKKPRGMAMSDEMRARIQRCIHIHEVAQREKEAGAALPTAGRGAAAAEPLHHVAHHLQVGATAGAQYAELQLVALQQQQQQQQQAEGGAEGAVAAVHAAGANDSGQQYLIAGGAGEGMHGTDAPHLGGGSPGELAAGAGAAFDDGVPAAGVFVSGSPGSGVVP